MTPSKIATSWCPSWAQEILVTKLATISDFRPTSWHSWHILAPNLSAASLVPIFFEAKFCAQFWDKSDIAAKIETSADLWESWPEVFTSCQLWLLSIAKNLFRSRNKQVDYKVKTFRNLWSKFFLAPNLSKSFSCAELILNYWIVQKLAGSFYF